MAKISAKLVRGLMAFAVVCIISFSGYADEATWKSLNVEARDLFVAGDPDAAIQKAEEGLEYAKAHLPPENPSVIKSLNNLGVLHFTKGDIEQAASYYQRALSLTEKTFGATHGLAADTLINFSRVEMTKKNHGGAVSSLERALSIREQEFGKDHEQVGGILQLLVPVYVRMGLTDEAREAHERIQKIIS